MPPKTLLIAALRNEGPFLLEWVAYHRLIGFSEILLFVGDSIDGTDGLAQALAEAGAVTLVPNPGPGTHRARALRQAASHPLYSGADWAMVLDIDEFLCVRAGAGRLDDVLVALPTADLISLTWRNFGSNGVAHFAPLPVTTQFTAAAPRDVALHARQFGIKTLFRPQVAQALGPHRPMLSPDRAAGTTAVDWRNGDGAPVEDRLRAQGWQMGAEAPGYALAQINHYITRSVETFALQHLSATLAAGEPQTFALADFTELDSNQETDTAIARHAAALTAAMDALLAVPAIAQAQAECVARTQDLIAQMRAAADDPALLAFLGSAEEDALTPEPAPVEDSAPRWLADLRRSNHRMGWYRSSDHFAAQFTQRSADILVVSFDNLSNVTDSSLSRETWGYGFYAAEGWSHLGVMAFSKNWYRDEALFDFLEEQARAGFFAPFRQVVLTGTSMGAYAATAFASLVPGCTVVAFSPQSTLDTALVPWEERFNSGRKQDWSGRYRDAPDHTAAARAVFVIYDPYFVPDARHAARYAGANVHHLKSWYASHKSAQFMRRAEILKDVMRAAVAGTLTPALYYSLFRARRDLPWYYNGLSEHLIARGHRKLAAQLAAHLRRSNRPGIARAIESRL